MNKPLMDQAEIRLRRLRFRSNHRGCKETDLVLGAFADTALAGLDAATLDVFERLLDENDAEIWDWLTDKTEPPHPEYKPLIDRMKQYHP